MEEASFQTMMILRSSTEAPTTQGSVVGTFKIHKHQFHMVRNHELIANFWFTFRKDMSVAQWDAARGTAEVVVKKGKAWTATGVTRGSQTLAFIEEIV